MQLKRTLTPAITPRFFRAIKRGICMGNDLRTVFTLCGDGDTDADSDEVTHF